MRFTAYPFKTFREDPKDVEMANLRLLLRSGMLVQIAGGVYVYTHFLHRTIQKITRIVRQEMDRAGAVEITMPILQPRSLWEQTGRWDDYLASKTMLHLRDRQGGELGLGPTAEEVVTYVATQMIRSYRDLPTTLYQIGPKFRDELRLRGGLIRGREFIMKDAYSFDVDQPGLDESYEAQRQAYERAFTRCGLPFIQVEADSGAIGGSSSHEFMVVAPAGEDKVITCTRCDYKANVERAVSVLAVPNQDAAEKPMHLESTPNTRTVDELVTLFSLPASRMVKTILYDVAYKDGRREVVAVLMRGDCDINEVKLANHLGGVASLETASPEVVVETTNADVGFAGPVGLKARIVADESVRPLRNFLCGGNRTDYHILDVNWGRDFSEPVFVDVRSVAPDEACVHCGAFLQVTRGIEVGHLFKLGTKYSHKPDEENPHGLSAVYLDEAGVSHDILMGCYGIGVTRIAAAAIEISHDDKGIIWPFSIAPYEVVIVTAGSDPEAEKPAAEALYEDLVRSGVDVAYDDRDERIGIKLNDADLIGFPYKLIVGRGLKEGVVDFKSRSTGETVSLAVGEAPERIRSTVEESRGLYK